LSSSLLAFFVVGVVLADGLADALLLGLAGGAGPFFLPLSLLVFFFLSALLVQPFGALAAAFDPS
jgi:hypothetical protein